MWKKRNKKVRLQSRLFSYSKKQITNTAVEDENEHL